MLRSATLKLTLYYLLIIAVISIGFSTALYHVATRDLAAGLQRQTERIRGDFPVFTDSPYLHTDDELSEAKQHLLGRLILFNILMLSAAGLGSYVLARRTLQPVQDNHERQKRFTADVSHELRTPLTALTMESQVALMDAAATKKQLRDVISSNIEEAEKLTTLVSNLLLLSKLDANAAQTRTNVSVNQAINDAVGQLQPVAVQRNITITVPSAPKVAVAGNQSTMTQLFVILLDNAIKYSSADASISISAELRGSQVVVAVRDQGIGIAKDDLDRVFERFYRSDSARTSGENSGFGLGLSIAKLIADSHDATLELSSCPGRGTTARVIFERQLSNSNKPRAKSKTSW